MVLIIFVNSDRSQPVFSSKLIIDCIHNLKLWRSTWLQKTWYKYLLNCKIRTCDGNLLYYISKNNSVMFTIWLKSLVNISLNLILRKEFHDVGCWRSDVLSSLSFVWFEPPSDWAGVAPELFHKGAEFSMIIKSYWTEDVDII